MKRNTETASNGSEIYTHEILTLADEYINSLDDPEAIKGNNKGPFTGMIKYIYSNYFKNNSVNNEDIDTLNNIWDIYTSLCYKYNKRPTLLNFGVMVNISMDCFNDWKNGTNRAYIYLDDNNNKIKDINTYRLNYPDREYKKVPSSSHSQAVKKWLAECEASLFDGATENNSIGCIFALKANYGYTETAPVPTINPNQIANRTPEQIAQTYGEVVAEIPEIPQNT